MSIRSINMRPERCERILVVAPGSALGSWERELQLEGETDYVFITGTAPEKADLIRQGHRWNLLHKEGWFARTKRKTVGLPVLIGTEWDVIIMDESASCIRYADTKITKFFLKNFKDVRHRYVMAGRLDPQNDCMGYWTQIAFALGGKWMNCDSFWKFRVRYFNQIAFKWVPLPKTRERIRDALAEVAVVCSRKDVGMDVPKTFTERWIEMPEHIRKVYKRAEEDFILEFPGDKKTWTQWAIVKYQWLRQMSSGFIQGDHAWHAKVQELVDLVTGELSGEKVVVVCSFNQEVYAIMSRLCTEGIPSIQLTGNLDAALRRQEIERFKTSDSQVLVCQVKCIDTGLDLGVSDTMIFYSLPFGVLTWIQSQERCLGDLTKAGVSVIALLTKDSVDEDVWSSLQRADNKGREFLSSVQERFKARVHAPERRSGKESGVGVSR